LTAVSIVVLIPKFQRQYKNCHSKNLLKLFINNNSLWLG
jgi:hypothetical protein